MARFVKAWALSALGGIGLWGLCLALEETLGFRVACGLPALATCGLLGIPGSIFLLILRLTFAFG